ncbi:dihydrolipoamide acetyltransferase family protein [Conexibacter sp. CPCC 206217]|uniref:dihydrolipoamide acetyltransferase family protein n=1 Tax=Conexibacter sp. CPCC 206217 TaxID=3064574 RepID=UPI002718D26D|nr:dihydrolipoamide acetyltransferase family protein [Conexibacter sp. CPCC 206217]MDO8210093.1 dihydrolipoamide acetyltransferase family protein [Conexibacter sp. CPCC 206217]
MPHASMHAEVAMPRLTETMEEATVARWLRADGDEVAVGDELVEIETDKATTVHEATADGRLRVLVQEGATAAVGATLATIAAEPAANVQGRFTASPVARRIAREHGVELAQVRGSGPHGRVLKFDVLSAIQQEPAPAEAPRSERKVAEASPEADGAPLPVAADGSTWQDLSRIQQVVARRMAAAKASVPDFAVAIEIDMGACRELRAELGSRATPQRPAPSYNDMVVKATALSLRDTPRANASFRDGRYQLHDHVNVGVAVAGDGTLVVPTVFDADRLSLIEIARTTRHLAASVRDGSIEAGELAGGTCTVSNLGMFGVSSFTAIINPPQAAIVAVGAIVDRPVARAGEVVIRPIMTVSLVADHRILYGADAAAFLARLRDRLEDPLTMAL